MTETKWTERSERRWRVERILQQRREAEAGRRGRATNWFFEEMNQNETLNLKDAYIYIFKNGVILGIVPLPASQVLNFIYIRLAIINRFSQTL
jgi:hypothetical protein